jgi:dephospho-CoA kinase
VITIGLTGGIGSGKTTAAAILAELGAAVIDADKVGHAVYAPGTTGWRRVVDAFGTAIIAPDGSVDRKRLGSIVFADQPRLEQLNAIVHPLIAEAIHTQIAERRTADSQTPIVVEAAVLLEANWQTLVDEVWLVVASPSAVIERVENQRGLSRAAIEARIASQLSDTERRSRADVVIDNSGSLAQLRAQLERLWRERVM